MADSAEHRTYNNTLYKNPKRVLKLLDFFEVRIYGVRMRTFQLV